MAPESHKASHRAQHQRYVDGYLVLSTKAPSFDSGIPEPISPHIPAVPDLATIPSESDNGRLLLHMLIREKAIGIVIWCARRPGHYMLLLKNKKCILYETGLYQAFYFHSLGLTERQPEEEDEEAIRSLGAPYPPGELIEGVCRDIIDER